jgi:hypothetical protein
MNKPKGKIPSLISGSSGRPEMASAQRVRKCVRCKTSVAKGNNCFEIPKPGGGFSSKKTFCLECFGNILNQTQIDIDKLKIDLESVCQSEG